MVTREALEKQLKKAGCNYRFWGRGEIAELPKALMDGENVMHCVNGHYEGGFALLCATDHRVLLIDRKPMNYLNLQDVRFEMISEFKFHHRMLDATAFITTPTQTLTFISWNQAKLRALLSYVQQRVIELRQQLYVSQQFQQMAMQQLQQSQQPAPTFVPNMAPTAPTSGIPFTGRPGQSFSQAASTLGAFTYAKLPRFNHHSSRRIGRYAIPDEILSPGQFRATFTPKPAGI